MVVPFGYQTTYTCNSDNGWIIQGKNFDTVRYLTCIFTGAAYQWSNSSSSYVAPDVCAREWEISVYAYYLVSIVPACTLDDRTTLT